MSNHLYSLAESGKHIITKIYSPQAANKVYGLEKLKQKYMN